MDNIVAEKIAGGKRRLACQGKKETKKSQMEVGFKDALLRKQDGEDSNIIRIMKTKINIDR